MWHGRRDHRVAVRGDRLDRSHLRAAQRLRTVRPRAPLPRETRENDASRSILDPTSPHDTLSVSSSTRRIGVISVTGVIPEQPNVYERSASEQKSCLICSQLGCFWVACAAFVRRRWATFSVIGSIGGISVGQPNVYARSASERSWNSLQGSQNFNLNAEAGIWP